MRTLLVLLTFACVLIAYFGTYYRLSRRGMVDAAEWDSYGFYYITNEEIEAHRDLTEHYRRAEFFAPANWIDQQFFGGPNVGGCILFDLEG